MKADLHIHTKYSFDGETSIDDIFTMARNNNIDCIALTDHNDVRANFDALKYDRSCWIPGIEIDCYFNSSIYHIVGLGIDFNSAIFRTIASNYMNELERIASIRINVFNRLFSLNMRMDEIKNEYPGRLITNVEITRFMFNHYPTHPLFQRYLSSQVKSNPLADFYWDYCAVGKPGYVKMVLPDVRDVLHYIHQHHGIAILAHPLISVKSLTDIAQLKSLDGIEAYCSYHSEDDCMRVKAFAKNEGLLISAGSDYHGINKPAISIGDTHENGDSDEWFLQIKEAIARNR